MGSKTISSTFFLCSINSSELSFLSLKKKKECSAWHTKGAQYLLTTKDDQKRSKVAVVGTQKRQMLLIKSLISVTDNIRH